jgi:hypothetical protein
MLGTSTVSTLFPAPLFPFRTALVRLIQTHPKTTVLEPLQPWEMIAPKYIKHRCSLTTMVVSSDCHALVVGASGIIGWSVVDQLLQPYPSPSPFRKIIALVNRPLKLEDSFWPEHIPGRPELVLASGVNLLCEDEVFEQLLREKVADVTSVSHVYYFGKLCNVAEAVHTW